MRVIAYVAAGLLALVFVRAGVAKINRPSETATAFEAMAVPAPRALARALPFVELALAVALIARPRIGGALALAMIAAFSAVLARSVGTDTGCGCFGSPHARPVSRVDLARNAILAALAIVAIVAG